MATDEADVVVAVAVRFVDQETGAVTLQWIPAGVDVSLIEVENDVPRWNLEALGLTSEQQGMVDASDLRAFREVDGGVKLFVGSGMVLVFLSENEAWVGLEWRDGGWEAVRMPGGYAEYQEYFTVEMRDGVPQMALPDGTVVKEYKEGEWRQTSFVVEYSDELLAEKIDFWKSTEIMSNSGPASQGWVDGYLHHNVGAAMTGIAGAEVVSLFYDKDRDQFLGLIIWDRGRKQFVAKTDFIAFEENMGNQYGLSNSRSFDLQEGLSVGEAVDMYRYFHPEGEEGVDGFGVSVLTRFQVFSPIAGEKCTLFEEYFPELPALCSQQTPIANKAEFNAKARRVSENSILLSGLHDLIALENYDVGVVNDYDMVVALNMTMNHKH